MSRDQHAVQQRRVAPLAHEVRRVAILRALFLGDLLMTTPAWRALRRRFPRAEITLIGLPWAAEFVARVPGLIDRLVPFPGYPGLVEQPVDQARTAAFLAEQRAYGYDLALQMHGDGSITNGLVRELGARATVGRARPGDERLDLAIAPDDGENEVLSWLRLVALLGAPTGDTRLELQVGPADEARADELLARRGDGPLIGLHLGAKDPARRWPAERFAALGAALRRHTGATLVLTGGAHEAELTAPVARALGPAALDLTGRTDLGALAAVVRRLDLLVSNDTGASHVAAAVAAPSLVLFGPTRPAQFAPLERERHAVIDAAEQTPAQADAALALRHLPVAPVLAAALTQLARHARPLAARSLGGAQEVPWRA